MAVKKIDSLRVEGINPEYDNKRYITIPNQETKELRWWQPECFEQLKNTQFAICAAFCGSGKSILQVALAIHDIVENNWKQKQLIIVPQQHISQGFIGDEILEYIPVIVNGEKYEWKVMNNFCDEKNVGILRKLKKWLLQDAVSLSCKHKGGNIITGINAVASHQALSMVWNKLTEAEKKKAIKNLTLRVDEAHHVKGVFDVNENGLTDQEKLVMEEESTNLGKICKFMFNKRYKNSKIHLTTATPYRGDKRIILSPDVLKKFEVYYLDWIEHFKTTGIKNFFLEYQEYNSDPIRQVIANIKAEPNEKHLVIIPSSTHKWRSNGNDELQDLLTRIHKVVPKERVLDLVTKSTQSANKLKLLKEPKDASQGESKYDVVVTCMLGREGTDWCPCSRLHNTACENSITLAVQTMGRPFRRFKGKQNVKMCYYIKRFKKPKKGMTKRELLSDRTNALLVCLQLDEMCHPIMIPVIPQSADNKSKNNGNGGSISSTSLTEVFGDQYPGVKQELFEEIECLEKKDKQGVYSVIDNILDKYNVSDDVIEGVRDAMKVLVLRVLSPKLRNLGIDIAFLREHGFDKIIKKHKLQDTSIFFGSYNDKDWKIIRSILNDWEMMFEKLKEHMEERKNER